MLERPPRASEPLPDFTLGGWLVQPGLNRISREGMGLRIRPQLIDVLSYLAKHAHRTLTKDELLEALWPGQFIVESGLARCIAELRRLLGDSRKECLFIETVPKRGYRLVASVTFLPATQEVTMSSDRTVGRKQFLNMLGRGGIGTCMCGAVLAASDALDARPPGAGEHPEERDQQQQQTEPDEKSPARAAKRMEFVDAWVPRFFAVMDANLDEPTRRRIMAANGKACFSAFQPDLKRRPEPATRERIAEWVAANRGKGYSMDGDAIILEYVASAETKRPSPKGVCLCPTAEAQASGTISPTFCWCSVGYVKEMHERAFGRSVNVELVESVLMGQPRCRFRVTLA